MFICCHRCFCKRYALDASTEYLVSMYIFCIKCNDVIGIFRLYE